MLVWQILAVIIILAFIIIAVLAFIEPGPLHRRSRNPRGKKPETSPTDHDDEQR